MYSQKILYSTIALLCLLAALVLFGNSLTARVIQTFSPQPAEVYTFYEDAHTFMYHNRSMPAVTRIFKESIDSLDIYHLSFATRPLANQTTILSGLLILPSNHHNLPALVLLPGGGQTKENAQVLARIIARQGIAVLVIDQRGIGETGGAYLVPQQDYQLFRNGIEPLQHLAVYDALHAFDVLRSQPEIDKNRIAIAGESMGGRYALIAAALEPDIKGVISISTSGFHFINNPFSDATPYLRSIDPDHYIDTISPRPVFMFHSIHDTVVPLADAQRTFNKTLEPKSLFITDNESCAHGYCDAMHDALVVHLKELFP